MSPPPQRRPADDGPTLGEVSRQLAEVAQQLRDLIDRLDLTYVRRDVYDAQREGDLRTLTELRRDADAIVDQQRQNRRLAVSGIVLPILSGLILAVLLAALMPSAAP